MQGHCLSHIETGVEDRVLCTCYDALQFSAAVVEVCSSARGPVRSLLCWGLGLRARDGCEVVGCWLVGDDVLDWSGIAADLLERGLSRVAGPIRLGPELAPDMGRAHVALACFQVGRPSSVRPLDASVDMDWWRAPRVWDLIGTFDSAVRRALRRHGSFGGPSDVRAFATSTLARMERHHLQDLHLSRAALSALAGDGSLAARRAARA